MFNNIDVLILYNTQEYVGYKDAQYSVKLNSVSVL